MRASTLRSLLFASLVALIATGSTGTSSRAQTGASPDARTPAEEEALETLENGLFVSARSQAEAILRRDPDSIVGHYVLGRAFFDAEGSLARAMFHLGRARELYENTTLGTSGSPFHQELLFQTARLAGQMELFEFQLELLGYHDHLYDPDMIAERCWPLMKLGRMDEARQFANTAVGSPNRWQRSAGFNALCAVEGEARTREPYHEACLAALEDARRDIARARGSDQESGGIAVDSYNAALGAASALRFAEAEQYAEEGVRVFEPTPANPWRVLVELRVSQGRMDPALEAFGQMLRWNDRQPAALRDQSRADIEATVALVLLFAGESEQALMRIDRALERPDRRGLTTDGADQARGRHALMRRIIRRTLAQERAEEASWSGVSARALSTLGRLPDGLATWPDAERVVAVMTDEPRLTDTLRPYVPGGIDQLSPWMVGELVDVLGPAVVAVALEEARRVDGGDPRVEGHYLALEAEIAAARGEGSSAIELATQAMAQLEEPGWALVRARVAAVAGAAAEASGQHRRANELFTSALETDPGVFRRLAIPLPVRVQARGGALASEAADLLEASPRFDDRDGFVLEVSDASQGGLRACLRTATGNEIRCAEVRPPEEPAEDAAPAEGEEADADEEEPLTVPQLLAREVHRQLFSARIQLSGVDLSSLDGRTNGGSAVANERLRELMAPTE